MIKHCELQSSNIELPLPMMPVGILVYTFPLLKDHLSRNNSSLPVVCDYENAAGVEGNDSQAKNVKST